MPSDDAQINFDPESASARGYYDLAPYHKELNHEAVNPPTPVRTPKNNNNNIQSDKSTRSKPVPSDESFYKNELPVPIRPSKLPLEMKRDPNYTNRGIKLLCHFVRLNLKPNNIHFQATLYHGKDIIDIGQDPCSWLSPEVDKTEAIEVDQLSKIKVSKDGILVNKDDFREN